MRPARETGRRRAHSVTGPVARCQTPRGRHLAATVEVVHHQDELVLVVAVGGPRCSPLRRPCAGRACPADPASPVPAAEPGPRGRRRRGDARGLQGSPAPALHRRPGNGPLPPHLHERPAALETHPGRPQRLAHLRQGPGRCARRIVHISHCELPRPGPPARAGPGSCTRSHDSQALLPGLPGDGAGRARSVPAATVTRGRRITARRLPPPWALNSALLAAPSRGREASTTISAPGAR